MISPLEDNRWEEDLTALDFDAKELDPLSLNVDDLD